MSPGGFFSGVTARSVIASTLSVAGSAQGKAANASAMVEFRSKR
jgi:hypothetical protein